MFLYRLLAQGVLRAVDAQTGRRVRRKKTGETDRKKKKEKGHMRDGKREGVLVIQLARVFLKKDFI